MKKFFREICINSIISLLVFPTFLIIGAALLENKAGFKSVPRKKDSLGIIPALLLCVIVVASIFFAQQYNEKEKNVKAKQSQSQEESSHSEKAVKEAPKVVAKVSEV